MHFVHLQTFPSAYVARMTLLQNSLYSWADNLTRMIEQATMGEMLAAILLPLLALLIRIRVGHLTESKPGSSLQATLADRCAPLIGPVLSILFTALALVVLKDEGYTPTILAFAFKLSVAWLAVHAVILLSSGRSAGLFIGLVIIPVTLLHLFGLWDATETMLTDADLSIGHWQLNVYQLLKGIVTMAALIWGANLTIRTTDTRLRRMRTMRASSRNLILKFAQITLYVIVFVAAMQLFGVNLTTLSIFGGALGVGIGFGLQKIASNFISGIILLFEKSIEVDDVIELGSGVVGTVKHTSARFTLVSTFDGREMMIPNEEFISQRVISYTHSDHRVRIEIPVSVGYDDDLELALQLLVKAAGASKRTLKDPGPAAYATSFGDSGINLSLFFWVDNVQEGRNEPRTQVMLAIVKSFKAAGISIPYPIREIHQPAAPAPKAKKA